MVAFQSEYKYTTNNSKQLLISTYKELRMACLGPRLLEKSIVFCSFPVWAGKLSEKVIILYVGTKVFMMTNGSSVCKFPVCCGAGPQGSQES